MAVTRNKRFRVEQAEVFPHGAYLLGIEPDNDFDRVRAGAVDAQKRDRETGERIWVGITFDPDPEARTHEVRVRLVSEVQPVPPPGGDGPFRPVEFEGLTVLPYIKDGPRPRIAYSLRATGMRAPGRASSAKSPTIASEVR